jgi:hypothetical protein
MLVHAVLSGLWLGLICAAPLVLLSPQGVEAEN